MKWNPQSLERSLHNDVIKKKCISTYFFYVHTEQGAQMLPTVCSQWYYGIRNWNIMLGAEGIGNRKEMEKGKVGEAPAWLFESGHQTRLKPFI